MGQQARVDADHHRVRQLGIVLTNAERQVLQAESWPSSSWIGRSSSRDKVIGLPLTTMRTVLAIKAATSTGLTYSERVELEDRNPSPFLTLPIDTSIMRSMIRSAVFHFRTSLPGSIP